MHWMHSCWIQVLISLFKFLIFFYKKSYFWLYSESPNLHNISLCLLTLQAVPNEWLYQVNFYRNCEWGRCYLCLYVHASAFMSVWWQGSQRTVPYCSEWKGNWLWMTLALINTCLLCYLCCISAPLLGSPSCHLQKNSTEEPQALSLAH